MIYLSQYFKGFQSFGCAWGFFGLAGSFCWQLLGQTSFPVITQINPNVGEPGTVVVVYGRGFTGVSSVMFGVGSASFESVSANQIRAVVPEDATTGAITVSTDHGFATSHIFFQVAPRIIRFEPAYGKPGDTILLRGVNLSGLNSLRVGTIDAAFSTVSDSQLSFVIPAGAATGLIRLSSPAGQADSESSLKVIGPEPYITSFEPSVAAPGTLVAIRGVQLSNASQVLFGDDLPGTFSVVADTQILVRIPDGAASGPVKVTTPLGQGISEMDLLVTGSGPFITSLSPDHGQQGDSIVVSGINLTGVIELKINDVKVSFEVVADTQMSFVIPADATSGPLSLRTVDEEFVFESGITVDGPGPVLGSFSPTSGLPGDTIQLIGSHFAHVQSVRFGEVEAAFQVTAETQMTVGVPEGAETAPITIVTAFGETQSSVDFLVKQPAPELDGVTPAFGPVGTQITLQGIYLNSVTNVVVGGKDAAFEIVADSQILTRVPASAQTGLIELQSGAGTVVSSDFFYLPATVQSVEPATAVPGALVSILGNNFTGASRVRFGGVEADIVSVQLESVQVTVPAAALIGPVSVTTPAGSIATPFDYGVLPEVESMTPLAGPVGTLLEIHGRGFTEVLDVVIGLSSVPFEIKSPELLELEVPFNATSGSIIVRNPIGQSASIEPFQVRTAADLNLEVSMNNLSSSWLTPSRLTIRVHNAGPSAARNFFVRHQMPEGVTRLSGLNTGGSTEIFGQVVVDRVVSLNAGQTVEIQHVVSSPFHGFLTHVFRIDADIFDPTADDWNVEFRRRIVGPPVRLNVILGPEHSVHLRWPPALRGYELQMNEALNETGGWSSMEAQPVFEQDWQQITLPKTDLLPTRFFRLQAKD